MSDNYKLLAKAREYMLELQSDKGYVVTNLVNETGLAHTLVCNILEDDPVSIKVREATLIKLRAFIDKYEMTRKEPEPKKSKINKGDASAFSSIEVPESMKDAIPEETKIDRDKEATENLLLELSELANRFQMQGYRLKIKIHMIYTP